MASEGFSRKALKSLLADYKVLCSAISVGFISLELDFVHQFSAAESWKHKFSCQFVERQLAAKALVIISLSATYWAEPHPHSWHL